MKHESTRLNQPLDPIWHIKSSYRVWKGLWVGFSIIYLLAIFFVPAGEESMLNHVLIFIPFLLFSTFLVFNEVRARKYWRQIGERRSEAFRDPGSFRTSTQPVHMATSLQFPVTIRLRSNPKFIVFIALLLGALLGFMILIVFVENSFGKPFSELAWVLLLLVFPIICIITFFIIYTVLRRYYTQFELTEEALSTKYLGQKRSLRWEDARVFAQYRDGLLTREVNGVAFELSNEHTVVRWSQQRLTSRYLKVQSNQQPQGDFNGLLEQINAYVVQRTGLALIDLDDVTN